MLFYLAVPLFLLVSGYYAVVSSIAMLFDRSGKSYYPLFRGWSRKTLFLFRVHVTVQGKEKIGGSAQYVYIANHSSYLDIPVLVASIPDDVRFMFKYELTKVPIWGWSLLVSPNI